MARIWSLPAMRCTIQYPLLYQDLSPLVSLTFKIYARIPLTYLLPCQYPFSPLQRGKFLGTNYWVGFSKDIRQGCFTGSRLSLLSFKGPSALSLSKVFWFMQVIPSCLNLLCLSFRFKGCEPGLLFVYFPSLPFRFRITETLRIRSQGVQVL